MYILHLVLNFKTLKKAESEMVTNIVVAVFTIMGFCKHNDETACIASIIKKS